MEHLIHIDRPWLKKVLEISSLGKGNVYSYGSGAIANQHTNFHKDGYQHHEPYEQEYKPNPYEHQYDMEIHCFMNYDQLRRDEIRVAENIIKSDPSPENFQRLEFVRKHGATGIPRHEHLFNAAEIRWPTTEFNGTLTGALVRDPWSIKRYANLSNSNYNYNINFGGGGQGKTWTYLAFMLMVFEHYIFTANGAKCSFSSVNKDKLNGVQWPHLMKLLNRTKEGISLYAGQSVIGGDWTLKRPNSKDTGGVFKGILVGNASDQSSVTDKLTGTHGHHAYCYLIDEMQSTPEAPIEASGNYMSTGTPAWVIGCGNYNRDNDSLGANCAPILGWETVDKDTEQWISEIKSTGSRCQVLHLNNENCPAVLDPELAKRYPHLPNRKKRDKKHPIKFQNNSNESYRRFWVGFRAQDLVTDVVVSSFSVEQNGANAPLNLSSGYPRHTFFSFDSAHGQGDRNILGIFQEGHEEYTEDWVWGLVTMDELEKVRDIRTYYAATTSELVKKARKWNLEKNDSIILDWSNLNGHVSALSEYGYEAIGLVYQASVPDGKKRDRQGRVGGKILINPNTNEFAHQICRNKISFGAYLLREYVANGRVRGINSKMLANLIEQKKSLEDEMFTRKFENVIDNTYGELLSLGKKKKFRDEYGFSPDILDVWFQAAYYMFVHRGMPIYRSVDEENRERTRAAKTEDYSSPPSDLAIDSVNEVWEDDGIDFTTGEAVFDDIEIEYHENW